MTEAVPPRPPFSDGSDGSDEELYRAIEEASASLGVSWSRPDFPEPEGPDAPAWRRRVGWGVAGAVALVVAWGLVGPVGPRTLPPAEVEADLRWAVGQVVEAVEDHRLRQGRLPTRDELHGLMGDFLEYRVEEGRYRVTGRRDGVVVTWDGTVPLERWRAGSPPS